MKKSEILEIRDIIRRALEEDIGEGDITSESTIPPEQILTGTFIAKAPGIIAGLTVVSETFKLLDKKTIFSPKVCDGSNVLNGQIIAKVRGRGRALLGGERTALNFLQRMSGIATLTRSFVDAVPGNKCCHIRYTQDRSRTPTAG